MSSKENSYRITGRVVDRATRNGIAGLRVEAWDKDHVFDDLVGSDETDADGRFRIEFSESYFSELFFDRKPDLYFKVFSGDELLASTKESVLWNEGAAPVEIAVAWAGGGGVEAARVMYTVEGAVVSRERGGVGGLRVQVVDKNIGADVPLDATVTDERGRYRVSFTAPSLAARGKQRPDLQARAYAGQEFLAASEVRYNATEQETLSVLLPADSAALPSEYEALTRALAVHYRGALGDLKESGERQDVTYLANKTGWDARAVALAALAEQFSRRDAGEADIHPAFYYALFRAGLPADRDTLYRADAASVARVWAGAAEQGIIPRALAGEVDKAAEAFRRLGAERALDARPLAGTSTLKEMLDLTLGPDVQRQRQFAELYTRHRRELPKFWNEVRRAFGEETERQLRLDGQLGYLTLDNAPLIRRLRDAERQEPLSSTLDLARRGYFRAEKWERLLDGAVPERVPGATPGERRAGYAALLAAQVRLSFPTAVIAEQVRHGEVRLAADAGDDADAVRRGVYDFLAEHQGKFEIGMQSVEQYIARERIGERVASPVKEELKRIQRVYQITPGDEAMRVLLEDGLDSAFNVVRYDEEEFVQTYGRRLGEETARRTHQKSQQVHNAVLNVVTGFVTSSNAPTLGIDSDSLFLDPRPKLGFSPDNGGAPNADDIIAYPTLEELFGSMDYCACDHCRSILSPAAYLVDLLLFVDRETNQLQNPLDVLLKRRPDIEFLKLTCENTNTILPYIDVVNETLEYFVANDISLEDYKGHDTGDAATAEELLASPQFVDETVYNTLKSARFPFPLPFHKALETLRRYFERFEFPLYAALETLRRNEALERPNAASYAWRDILMERLKLSRAEYALLTDGSLSPRQLYSYPSSTTDAQVLAKLSNVKTFTRRVGLTYEELVEILKTQFVNPGLTLIPRLEHLGVSFSTLKDYKDGRLTDEEFEALLPQRVNRAKYNGNVEAWVKNDRNYDRFMSLITIANPTEDEDLCNFDMLEFRYTNPDEDANRLRGFEFVRMLRFIRLWKKLGWSIEQTDKAITALYPPANAPQAGDSDGDNLDRLDAGFLVLLPRLGITLDVLGRLKLTAKDLPGLLALWSPIDVVGSSSLYRKMFLSPALQDHDEAFDEDGFGDFLQDDNEKVLPHAETLRAAFNLTGEEFSQLVASVVDLNNVVTPSDPPLTPETLTLTLGNITAIYRRGWLARKLQLSVREFLLLTQYAGLGAFGKPDIEQNPPEPGPPPLIRLLQLVGALKAAALKPVQALYLIWNQDISGQSAPPEALVHGIARSLRADFAAIESEYAVADDPNGDLARARMSLVYGQDAAVLFFGMLDGILTVEVTYAQPEPELAPEVLDAAQGRISYDDFRKRLSYTGVLGVETRDDLKAVAGVTAEFQQAVDDLFKANHQIVGPFFARYPELRPLYLAYVASTDPPEQKRTQLLTNFLPELKRRRKRQQTLTSVGASARTDPAFTQVMLDDAKMLHVVGDAARPALEDLTALETPGLSVEFFWRETASGPADRLEAAAPSLDYPASGELPANQTLPGGAISGIWSGYLDVPENGFYNISVETEPGASVSLAIDGRTVALELSDNVWSNMNALSLTAGTLHALTLTVERVRSELIVRWETAGRGREAIPARYLYSAALVANLRDTYTRFLKAAALAAGLKLTANEFTHMAAHEDYEIDGRGWLNSLAVTGNPSPETARALRGALTALLDFARLKAALAPDDERLLDPAPRSRRDPAEQRQPVAADRHRLGARLARLAPEAVLLRQHEPESLEERGEVSSRLRRLRAGHGRGRSGVGAHRGGDQRADLGRGDELPVGPARALRRGRLVERPQAHQRRAARAPPRRPRHLRPAQAEGRPGHSTPRHARQALRVLPDGRADGAVHADLAHTPRALLHPALHRALPDESGARRRALLDQGRPVGLDETLPRLGGEPQNLPLAGELARTRAARRPVPLLQGDDERAAAKRHHGGRGGLGAAHLPVEATGGRQATAVRHPLRRERARHGGRRGARRGAHVRREPQVLLPPARGRLVDAVGADQPRHQGQPRRPRRLEEASLHLLGAHPCRGVGRRAGSGLVPGRGRHREQVAGRHQVRHHEQRRGVDEGGRAGRALLERVL